MWGYPSFGQDLVDFCRNKGLVLIEDAAQAHGSSHGGRLLGTQGDVGCFSSHARKMINTGEGGFVLTSRDDLYGRLHSARTLGQLPGEGGFGIRRGMNFKLSGILAAVGSVQVGKLPERLAARRSVGDAWSHALAQIDGVTLVDRPDVHNGYGFAFLSPGYKKAIEETLRDTDLLMTDTLQYRYDVLYRYPVFEAFAASRPNAEALAANLVVMPCHEGVNQDVIDASCEFISKTVNS